MAKIVTSLKRLIGRIKMNAVAIYFGMGILAVTIAFTGLFTSDESLIKSTAMILIVIGFAMCGLAYKTARQKDGQEISKLRYDVQSTEDIKEELKNINININNLVEEIREDRNERSKNNKSE